MPLARLGNLGATKDNEEVNVVKAVGLFLVATLVMTFVLSFAWAGSWVTFGAPPGFDRTFQFSLIPAVLICSVFWIKTQQEPRSAKSFGWLTVSSALLLYIAISGLHYLKKPPTRFDFVKQGATALSTDPGSPGLLQTTYNFKGSPEHVKVDAASELTSLGYSVKRKNGGFLAMKDFTVKGGFEGVSVGISPGRVIGKRFVIDGDMIDIEKRNDWVIVDVTERDQVPDWLKVLSP